MNVTWRRFEQSAKQLIVGHTTMAISSYSYSVLIRGNSNAPLFGTAVLVMLVSVVIPARQVVALAWRVMSPSGLAPGSVTRF